MKYLARRLCFVLWRHGPRRRGRPPRRIEPHVILQPGQANAVGQHLGQLLQKLVVVLLCGRVLFHHRRGGRGRRRWRWACRTLPKIHILLVQVRRGRLCRGHSLPPRLVHGRRRTLRLGVATAHDLKDVLLFSFPLLQKELYMICFLPYTIFHQLFKWSST